MGSDPSGGGSGTDEGFHGGGRKYQEALGTRGRREHTLQWNRQKVGGG